MKLSEIKFIYLTKTFNSYKRLVNEYVFVDFNNKTIMKMNEKQFEKFMHKNLNKLIPATSKVGDYRGVFIYLVKDNIAKIEKENNKVVVYLKDVKNFKDLFDFKKFELEHIAEIDFINFRLEEKEREIF